MRNKLILTAALLFCAGAYAQTNSYTVSNIVTNSQDPRLVNPWGLSRPASAKPKENEWWTADQVTGLSTLYYANGTIVGLAVTVPPSEERYGITNQLWRASVSVPSDIAEGQARFSQKEGQHFLSPARGSLVEIETQLLIARDLKYLQPTKADALIAAADDLGRALNGLIASIKNRAA